MRLIAKYRVVITSLFVSYSWSFWCEFLKELFGGNGGDMRCQLDSALASIEQKSPCLGIVGNECLK